VKATADEAAVFREEVLKWQVKFGLTDWVLTFKTEEGGSTEANVDYDCDTREATVTYYTGVADVSHPKDNALHEVLHLLFADMLYVATKAKSESDPSIGREEHRVIERIRTVMK
jgi:hypothetical protein